MSASPTTAVVQSMLHWSNLRYLPAYETIAYKLVEDVCALESMIQVRIRPYWIIQSKYFNWGSRYV